jgi:hypothetical protein
MPKKRKTNASSSGAGNDEPAGFHRVDLSHLANIDESKWPEKTRKYRGLKLNDEQKTRFDKLAKKKLSHQGMLVSPLYMT